MYSQNILHALPRASSSGLPQLQNFVELCTPHAPAAHRITTHTKLQPLTGRSRVRSNTRAGLRWVVPLQANACSSGCQRGKWRQVSRLQYLGLCMPLWLQDFRGS